MTILEPGESTRFLSVKIGFSHPNPPFFSLREPSRALARLRRRSIPVVASVHTLLFLIWGLSDTLYHFFSHSREGKASRGICELNQVCSGCCVTCVEDGKKEDVLKALKIIFAAVPFVSPPRLRTYNIREPRIPACEGDGLTHVRINRETPPRGFNLRYVLPRQRASRFGCFRQ